MAHITQLLQKTKIPEQKLGAWEIKKFTITKKSGDYFNMQQIFAGQMERGVKPGTYTKLINHETKILMMSDTPAELTDHREAIYKANGHCLIAGLGLGIIAEACLRKKEVTKVTILEIDKEVIELVKPYLINIWGAERLEIIQCNALEWKPPKDIKYGMAWFDIWPSIDCENWDEYKLLHRRYGRKADWKGSWGRDYIIKMNRESSHSYW